MEYPRQGKRGSFENQNCLCGIVGQFRHGRSSITGRSRTVQNERTQGGRADRKRGPEAKAPKKDSPPPPNPEWDPKDPAAVQYGDGAWGVAYVDNASPPNLFFRRSLGGGDPQYWRDQVAVEPA